MAAPVSEIDLYTALRPKPGDTEARDLIQYVKSSRAELHEEVKEDQNKFATKQDIQELKQELKQLISEQSSTARLDTSNLRSEMEKGFKEQLRWIIVLMLGFASLIITVIKLM
jgi:molecular chaperone GrpE (heat shock protein)